MSKFRHCPFCGETLTPVLCPDCRGSRRLWHFEDNGPIKSWHTHCPRCTSTGRVRVDKSVIDALEEDWRRLHTPVEKESESECLSS